VLAIAINTATSGPIDVLNITTSVLVTSGELYDQVPGDDFDLYELVGCLHVQDVAKCRQIGVFIDGWQRDTLTQTNGRHGPRRARPSANYSASRPPRTVNITNYTVFQLTVISNLN